MKKKDDLWEEVKKDFPSDPALQEIHYARLKLHEQTSGMSDKEFINFIKLKAKNQMNMLDEQINK